MRVGGVKIKGTFPAGITPGAGDVSFAETPPCVRVAHVRCDTTSITVTRYTVREAIITCSTAIALTTPNPRLATALASDAVTVGS